MVPKRPAAQDASNAEQTEKSFRTAIRFRASSTRSLWELRPTTSLAGLFAKRGKLDEARDARRHLQLVHRGLQHRRPEGRQELLPDFPRTKYLAESEKFGAQTNRRFV